MMLLQLRTRILHAPTIVLAIIFGAFIQQSSGQGEKCGKDDDELEAQVTTSACVNGQIIATISESGGGYEPPGTPTAGPTGPRSFPGSSTGVLTTSNKPALVPIRAGKEYQVSWQKVGASQVSSLHTRIEPTSLPSGYKLQIKDSATGGWKEQSRIDHFGAAAANPSTVIQKFRILPPITDAGSISSAELIETKFGMNANPNTNGLGLLSFDSPNHSGQNPAYDLAAARVTMGLGVAIENGVPVSAGRLVYRAPLTRNDGAVLSVTPFQLVYEAPDNIGVTVIQDTDGTILQIKASEVLAEVSVISSQKFEVSIYPISQVGSQSGSGQPFSVSGNALSRCVFERVNSVAIPFGGSSSGGGIAPYGVRITRFEGTDQIDQVDFGGRFTSASSDQTHYVVRRQDTSSFTIKNNRLFTSVGFGLDVAGVTVIAQTVPLYYRDETREVRDGSTITAKRDRRFLLHSVGGFGSNGALGGFGDQLISEKNYSSSTLFEESQTYFNINYLSAPPDSRLGPYNQGAFGKPAFTKFADGSWVRYVYDLNGQVAKTYRPYKGLPADPLDASDTNCILETSGMERDPTITLPNPAPTGLEDALKDLTGVNERRINGTTVAKSQSLYTTATVNGQPAVKTTTRDFFSSAGYVESSSESYHQTASESLRGKPATRTESTGEKFTNGYELGNFNIDTRIFTPSASGTDMRRTTTQGTTASPSGIANKTTRTLSINAADGRSLQETMQIFTGGSTYDPATVTDYFYDAMGELSRTERDGRIIHETNRDGLIITETAEDGVETVTTLDSVGRPQSVAKTDGPTSTYAYLGNTTTVTTGTLSRSTTTDWLGRTASQTDEADITQSYTYPQNGRDTETTYPGGLKVRTTRHPGGMEISETNTAGTKIIPRTFTHSVVAGGDQVRRTNIAGTTRWSETREDWLGRTKTVTAPAPSGTGTVVTTTAYNTAGQPKSESFSANVALAPRITEYSSLGRVFREGIDISGNSTLDLASLERITEYASSYEKVSSLWYEVRETKEYQDDNSGTPTLVNTTKTRLSGNYGGLAAHSLSTDANGRTYEASTAINRSTKTVTRTTNASDITEVEVETTLNGLLKETKGSTRHLSYGYDAQDRLWTTTNHRSGAVTTRAYNATTSQLESITDHLDNATTYSYYPASHKNAGLVMEIENAAQKSSYLEYNDGGQQTHHWGATTYPTARSYTSYGELETLTTYRDGSGWSGSTWPSATAGTGDVTTWKYFAATGRLEYKQDAATKKVSYTWKANGALHTRKWARNITTTYGYNGSGDPTSITYSDGTTPSVAIVPNRTGQAHTITDAAGLHTFTYEDGGQIDTEIITGIGPLTGITFDFSHASNGIAKTLDVTSGATTLYETERTFDPATGLLQRVESGLSAADYRYHLKSNLVHQVTLSHNSQSALVQSRRYDAIDRLKSISHFTMGTSMTPVDYTGYQHDELGRRERATRLDGSYWDYAYNDRSEVIGADRKLSDDTLLAGKQYHFDFDNIGNIISKQTGGDGLGNNRRSFTTPANNLNQYAGFGTPATIDILGQAQPGTLVTVNGTAAAFQNEFFRSEVTTVNANANGDWKAITTTDGTNTTTGHKYIAPANFTPVYDLDGNLTDDGEWIYVWDAENRLKTITHSARAQAAGAPYRRLEFICDYRHRRIERRVYHAPAGPDISTERYLYDVWNRVATMNASNQVQQRFTWGLDLSGSLQGAGGVGGLLWIEEVAGSTTHLVCLDGNGNVTSLINAATKAITAAYDYSPFGETIRKSGSYAEANPYRFSTKPQDGVTGLLYYGFRNYKPMWGVWLNCDPLEERGGVNLYGFVRNDGVGRTDFLGFHPFGRGEVDLDAVLRKLDELAKTYAASSDKQKNALGKAISSVAYDIRMQVRFQGPKFQGPWAIGMRALDMWTVDSKEFSYKGSSNCNKFVAEALRTSGHPAPTVPSDTVPLKDRIPSANQWFNMVDGVSGEWTVKYAVEKQSGGSGKGSGMVITVKKELPSFGDVLSYPGHIGVYLGHGVYVSSTAGPSFPEQNSDQVSIKPVNDKLSKKWIVPDTPSHR
jgi:RHS repeat-associated protein